METNYTVCFLIHIWLQICCSCPIVISAISSMELTFCFSFLSARPSAFSRCRRGPLSVLSLFLSLSSSSVLFYFTSVQAAHLFWLAWVQPWVGRCGRKEKFFKKRGWRWWWLEFKEGYQLKLRHRKNNRYRTSIAKSRQFPLVYLGIFMGVGGVGGVKGKAGGGGGQRLQYLISTS